MPLSKVDADAIEAGTDRYAVLIFRDQRVSDGEQIAFTRNFGQVESTLVPEARDLVRDLIEHATQLTSPLHA